MTDQGQSGAESPERRPVRRSNALTDWLFRPKVRRFLLPVTGVWILALDWLLFSSNLLTAWLATPLVIVLGFVLGGAGTFLAQRRAAKDPSWRAAFKALLAGTVVGVPWPIGGTLIGGWILFTSGLVDAKKGILRQ